MTFISLDLGGTKLAGALWNDSGEIIHREIDYLNGKGGDDVGELITAQLSCIMEKADSIPKAIGVSVPGIAYSDDGSVWAPNIPGWERYPLKSEIATLCDNDSTIVSVESDRTCYILGETWHGAAAGASDAIYLAVGTGIGAGIIADGRILHGASDIAGSVGWMALNRPFLDRYKACGCFETYASGDGIAKTAHLLLEENGRKTSLLDEFSPDELTAHEVFEAFDRNDWLAVKTLDICIEFWGMATANLISIFNPEVIVFGGGVFGPAVRFLDRIASQAAQWAQPISMTQVRLAASALGDDSGLIGAGRLAFESAGIVLPE